MNIWLGVLYNEMDSDGPNSFPTSKEMNTMSKTRRAIVSTVASLAVLAALLVVTADAKAQRVFVSGPGGVVSVGSPIYTPSVYNYSYTPYYNYGYYGGYGAPVYNYGYNYGYSYYGSPAYPYYRPYPMYGYSYNYGYRYGPRYW
jgi:hypothetical protein